MYAKILPTLAVFVLMTGMALAQTNGGTNNGNSNTQQNSGTQGGNTGTVNPGIDADNDGHVTLSELRAGMKGQKGDQIFSGLTAEQLRALHDECKNDNGPDNKSACDKLAKLKE